MLRLEILSRFGLTQQALDESVSYLLYMAEQTGTLGEHVGASASCNHGFASHIVHSLYRDVLGLRRIDPVNHAVQIRFSDLRLNWCEGRVPTKGGPVSLRWWKEGEKTHYRVNVPAAYALKVENMGGKELVRQAGE